MESLGKEGSDLGGIGLGSPGIFPYPFGELYFTFELFQLLARQAVKPLLADREDLVVAW
jgi:hypothetical protein